MATNRYPKGINVLQRLMYPLQDPMNFGAVLRSAYFLGVDKVCAVRENR